MMRTTAGAPSIESPSAATRSRTPRMHMPFAPRFAALWAALTYAVVTLALGYPALLGKFLVSPHSDEYIAGYAFRQYGASVLRATGHFPRWDPYVYGGVPFVAAMHGDIFYLPSVVLRLFLPTDVAMTWTFLIHIVLCGVFMYGFLRVAGVGFGAALLGGLAYLMGGPVAGLVSPGHDGKIYVSAMLPAALWLLTIGIRDGRRLAWGLLALVIGLAVLSPQPQTFQYLLLTAGFYALYTAFWSAPEQRPARNVALRRLGWALGAVVLGTLIGAVQFLPVRHYVAWSPRAEGTGWLRAISYSMPPEELINTYLPQFSGILERYWGRNAIHLHSEYLGAAVLVLFGIAFYIKTAPKRRFLWFWFVVFIVSVLWSLGGFTPFYHIVYAIVPGTKYFRAPSIMLMVVGFSTAVMAAIGMEAALAKSYTPRYLIGWLVAGLVIAVLATSGAFTNLATTIATPIGRGELVDLNAGAVIAGGWRSFLFVVLACAALYLYREGKCLEPAFMWGMTAIVAVDLWTILRFYWLFSAPASVLYASNPAIDYLAQLKQPARVLAIPLTAEAAPGDPYLGLMDGLMVHRIRNTLGYYGNEIRYYQMLDDHANNFRGAIGNPNFWALTNTQYLLTNTDSLNATGFSKVVGPVRDAAGTMLTLYRMPGEQPYAWVTPVIVKAPDDPVLATVLDHRFDVRTAALLDTSAKVQGEAITKLPAPLSIGTHVLTYQPGHVVIQLGAPAPAGSALVVSENYYPGWTALVDGKTATIGRADLSLIGVALPAGARRVELTFADPSVKTGAIITLVAVALSLVLFAAGAIADGRRRG